jgi:hypothetical protein
MKVLVSTKETQGTRSNDFCWVPVGEILTLGFECDGESIDGPCGCRRAMVGVLTRKATTTMRVVEMPDMTIGKLFDILAKSDKRAGFNLDPGILINLISQLTDQIKRFKNGTILERRGDKFCKRVTK